MAKQEQPFGQSLLQIDPARAALLEKMRDKLAKNVPLAKVREVERQQAQNKSAANWTLRILLACIFLLANFFFFGKKETILAHIGYQAVPALPKPSKGLSTDEQALYWTYALYDFRKFKSQFGIESFIAIDPIAAKRNLEALLPSVSTPTLGFISAYTRVAFREIKSGGARHE